jgi:hypothetical protein
MCDSELSRLRVQVTSLKSENVRLQGLQDATTNGATKRMRVDDDNESTVNKLVDAMIEKDRLIAQKDKKIASKEKKLTLKDEQLNEKVFCIEMKDRQLAFKDDQLALKDELLQRKTEELENEREHIRLQVKQATYDARCDLLSERARSSEMKRKLNMVSSSLGKCSHTLAALVQALGRDHAPTLSRMTTASKMLLASIKKTHSSYDWGNVLTPTGSEYGDDDAGGVDSDKEDDENFGSDRE